MNQDNMNCNEMLEQIRALMFMVNDLALYLDTHPCDMRALNAHSQYSVQLENLKNMYQAQYGPLSIYTPVNSWDNWVNNPWPWERGGM
ncbi:MAG: spore coat protein CotJB [Clostridia bacterium]|nr:spore coat protein CotJB [Clostridia bacterium]